MRTWQFTHWILQLSGTSVCLLWMVEPFDTNYHISAPGFPHGLNAADVRSVGAARRQENSTVSYLNSTNMISSLIFVLRNNDTLNITCKI
jgi:hypothetical protein